MSRFTMDNEKYHFVMGADRTTSAFFQIWQQHHEEQDMPLIGVDNQGVHIYGDIPDGLKRKIKELIDRFEISKQKGNLYPNIDLETINDIARRLGFPLSKRNNMVAYYDDFDYDYKE